MGDGPISHDVAEMLRGNAIVAMPFGDSEDTVVVWHPDKTFSTIKLSYDWLGLEGGVDMTYYADNIAGAIVSIGFGCMRYPGPDPEGLYHDVLVDQIARTYAVSAGWPAA